ncbi:MAG: ABC transporter substrate-binding protein [Candidatus Pacebacteria bacterium]|nr:ABC transporter substrate-binding protein [Candidatus Paceibacterota bacterium]
MLGFPKPRNSFATLKWPSKPQWRQFFKILNRKEKIFFFALLILIFASAIFLITSAYFKNTEIQAAAGGTFVEGAVGQPNLINPIYATSNNVDQDLVEFIFSGLMKYGKNSEIVPDIAKEVKIEDEGKSYYVILNENVFWADPKSPKAHKLTADDVVFTVKTIQNPDYKSTLRAEWVGVDIEKISDFEVLFKLKNAYSGFLENLTLKIIPQYIWQNISSQQFPLEKYNLNPIGSGPYKLENLDKNKKGYINYLSLGINKDYFGEKPNISKIKFRFYETEENLTDAAKKGEINGFSLTNFKNYSYLQDLGFKDYHLTLPRYFAVFFNPDKAKILSDINVRQALNYGTNKAEVIEKISDSKAKVVDSPILPEIYGFEDPEKIYQFDLEKAKNLLDKAGFKETESGIREKIVKKEPAFKFKSDLEVGSTGTEVEELQKCLAKDSSIYPDGEITGSFGQKTKAAVIKFQEKYKEDILDPAGLAKGTGTVSKATRAKLNELCVSSPEEKLVLKISLAINDQPLLLEIANILKDQWKALGVDLVIQTTAMTSSEFERDIMKPRNYEAILFGEVLRKIPDPFPFWDSIQKQDPGLNLAVYENKKVDELLEEARQNLNENERKEKLEEFQNLLIEDAPAVFLYSPDYIYFVSNKIKGVEEKLIIEPAKRFSGIENWYVKIKRIWK